MQAFCDPGGFADHWKRTRERLEDGMVRELPRFFAGQPAPVRAAIGRVLAGGKGLRGCLVYLLNEVLGGPPAAALARAMAVECVQAASLIHDDLVDADTVRRGRAATWTLEGPRRAVLLGDLIFATALQRVAHLGREDVLVLGDAIATMAAGAYHEALPAEEALPPADQRQDPPGDRASLYPRLVHLKTGVLFGTAAQLGALAAGAAAPLPALAFAYGARIGEAYQMADDLQDLVLPTDAAPPAPAQLALLAPALWHFCPDFLGGTHAAPTADRAMNLPRLQAAMRSAIEARLQQAEAAAGQLAAGAHGDLLRAAARHILGTMLAGAR